MAKQKLVEVKVGKKDQFYLVPNGYQVLMDPENLTAKFYRDYRSGYFTLNRLLVAITASNLKYNLKSPVIQEGKLPQVDTKNVKVEVIKYKFFFFPVILARFHFRTD